MIVKWGLLISYRIISSCIKILREEVDFKLKSVFCIFRYKYKWTPDAASLALCSGGEEGNQTTGETDAEDVVHVSRGSLRLEVIARYWTLWD